MTEQHENRLVIGSRGSPLALRQSNMVRDALLSAMPALDVGIEIIRTTGDRVQDRPLAEIGGKGLFTKEIETALLDRRIDLAVHSGKDMETFLPDGLALSAVMPREDPRDVFLSETASSLDELPDGSVIGTTSPRRQAQILHRHPTLKVTSIRGNVDTRLAKMKNGEVAATLLALAGLKRLSIERVATEILDPEIMLPSAAQGAIAIETRADDGFVLDCVSAINHSPTMTAVLAERALLAALDGSCRTPIGALAEFEDDFHVRIRGLIAAPDGSWLYRAGRRVPAADVVAAGRDAGAELRSLAGEAFFSD